MEIRRCASCGTIAGTASAIACAKCSGRLEIGDERELLGRRFGSYTLVDVLGAGGMGVVFAARHETLGRSAAVKLIQGGHAEEGARKRFLNEARLLAGLRHPNLVTVYDFAETEWGSPYLVLELLEGRSAESLVADAARRGEAGLPPAAVSAILADAVAGLDAAHAAGIVHRDLKPSNLFVALENGRARTKVIDFGIARARTVDAEATRFTSTSGVVGTPHYLAPEQILNDAIGPATDQFALALTACELLTGSAVREGMSLPEIVALEIREPVPFRERFPGLPSAMAKALERATDPDPARRHRDLAAFLRALDLPEREHGDAELLERLRAASFEPDATLPLGGESAVKTVPRPRTRTTVAATQRRRRRTWIGVASASGVLLVAIALGLRHRSAAAERRTAEPVAPTVSGAPAARRAVEPRPAPADGRAILGESDSAWVVGSPGAWTLIPKDGGEPTRVAWPVGIEGVARSARGGLWARRGDRFVELDPTDQKEQLLAEGLTGELREAPASTIAIAPRGGHAAVVTGAAIEVSRLGGRTPRRLFSVPLAAGATGRVSFAVTDSWLAVAQAEAELALYRLSDGKAVWRRALDDHTVSALALADGVPRLALAAATGEVRVFDLADGRELTRIARAGRVTSMTWIPDRPTLAIARADGLALWREGATEPIAVDGVAGCSDLHVGATALLCLDAAHARLEPLAYGAAPLRRSIHLGAAEAWAATATPPGGADSAVYVGTADGALHRVDPETGETTSHRIHDAGITALALDGERLASASDDRTLAVWRLPAMEVLYRSRAHAYLVNALDFGGGSLWSSSSDRVVKRWSWPALEELESVDVAAATGEVAELHALSVDRSGDRLWLGTWSGFVARLDRDGRRWRATSTRIEARSGYRWAVLPKAGLRVLLGIEPSQLLVFDDRGELRGELPTFDRDLYGLVVDGADGGGAFWATGGSTVLRFELAREAEAAVRWTARALVATDLGVASAAAASGDLLALATSGGDLHLLDAGELARTPALASGLLER